MTMYLCKDDNVYITRISGDYQDNGNEDKVEEFLINHSDHDVVRLSYGSGTAQAVLPKGKQVR